MLLRIFLALGAIAGAGTFAAAQPGVEHADCDYFGPKHEQFAFTGLRASRADFSRSALTTAVSSRLARASGIRAAETGAPVQSGLIDQYLFQAMQDAGVTPAGPASDAEFIRRVTLDLIGKVPDPDRVVAFLNDPAPDRRARLVEELLARPEWVDKWTMFFGDLFKNVDRNTQVNRYAQGRNAFYSWIHDSLAANKPYDEMARNIISATATTTWDPNQGAANWIVGGIVTGGPAQDIYDQQASNTAETFLGLGNVTCLLCHNGRGHLDQLNLWASHFTRYQAWQLASFFSRTVMQRTKPLDTTDNVFFYSVQETGRTDYTLGTTTGNRPARTIVAGKTVAPVYPFTSDEAKSGETYRATLAREITGDPQFARAAVNYIWQQFFTRGIVEPANQFDLARLDPDNPPPAPWTLQPSNARLLNALAQEFAANGFDLKALMREIATSRAYQLSSRYDGTWNPAWEPLFARKLVRRLWAEELHDAIAQTSGVLPSYDVNMSTTITADTVKINWAMQLPQTVGLPGGGVNAFLDSFLRGNRDDQPRNGQGSILQSLGLKNNTFVMSRIRGTGQTLLARSLSLPDDQLVDRMFLTALSRLPNAAEKDAALKALQAPNRTQAAEDLVWALYNKVDFVFNY